MLFMNIKYFNYLMLLRFKNFFMYLMIMILLRILINININLNLLLNMLKAFKVMNYVNVY